MSSITVTNIIKTNETASRSVAGVAAVWINFDGGGPPYIRNSLGVSGIVDNGTGDYTVNFSNSLNGDYFVSFQAMVYNTNYPRNTGYTSTSDVTASSTRFINGYCNPLGTAVAENPGIAGLSAHGDLA